MNKLFWATTSNIVKTYMQTWEGFSVRLLRVFSTWGHGQNKDFTDYKYIQYEIIDCELYV